MQRYLRLFGPLILIAATSCLGELGVDLAGSDLGGGGAGPDTGGNGAVDMGPTSTNGNAICGDGQITGTEQCDGNCPATCDDGNSCTTDSLAGASTTCDASCTSTDITVCLAGDGCCPTGCDASTDDDCSDSCGDGIVDEDETCDSNCPTACDDGNACTTSRLTGSPQTCNVQCSTSPVTACVDADGCCPSGCSAATDSDCGAVCGNGVVEGTELCDGDCPTSCDDGAACTADRLFGSADTCNARCQNSPITQCVGGDGCCPTMCNQLNDADCAAVCGNDVVEPGETCDGACPNCNDGVACTADSMAGSAATCDVVCSNSPITACVNGDGCCAPGCDTTNDDDCNASCGNGVIESGETCDPQADCPTSCDDQNACTRNNLVGSAQSCNAVCLYPPITNCTSGDGCCPAGCNANTDDDCAPICDNSIVEPGETCDPLTSCPAVPADCDDMDACTGDSVGGSAAACTAVCVHNDVTACIGGDGCCPTGCMLATDSDCTAVCGNSVVEPGEACDGNCPATCDDQNACTADSLTGSAAACTAECVNVAVTACVDGDGCCPAACDETNDDDCSAACGNGVIETGETCDPIASCPTACDDSNACTADTMIGSASNCTAACQYTAITMCTNGDGCCPSGCNALTDNDCSPICGNSVIEPPETCDPMASCPALADCDDANACTTDSLTGSAASCTAQCNHAAVTACVHNDGCCPTGCDSTNDLDCIDCRNPSTWPATWATLEDQIFAETNARRTQAQNCGANGNYPAAPAFTQSSQLREAARCHALEMVKNNYFSHTGLNGSSPGARIALTGYNFSTWGENIAAGNSTAVSIVTQWMNSDGHCRNIMNANFDQLGVGYSYNSATTYDHYSVQVFATPQ